MLDWVLKRPRNVGQGFVWWQKGRKGGWSPISHLKTSENVWVRGQEVRISPKMALNIKIYKVSYLIAFKNPPKWCVNVLGFWSSAYFFQNWIAISPKNKANKNIFSFFCTFCQKRDFCYSIAFCNSPITLKQYVLDESLLNKKCYRIIEV